jgi:predicted DNA-binding antitoxin AbrB/MazE fold protein
MSVNFIFTLLHKVQKTCYSKIRRYIMTGIQAVYDGNVFIPKKPCEISSGSEVTLTIDTITAGSCEKQAILAAFRQLTGEINELNKTDPLPSEFDEILSQRLQFRELANL